METKSSASLELFSVTRAQSDTVKPLEGSTAMGGVIVVGSAVKIERAPMLPPGIVIIVRANQSSGIPCRKIAVAYRIGESRGAVFKLVELPSVSEIRLNVSRSNWAYAEPWSA